MSESRLSYYEWPECFREKKRMFESFGRQRLNVIAVQGTHTKGYGMTECAMGSENEVWEGMEGVVVWCGVDDKSRGRMCTTNVS